MHVNNVTLTFTFYYYVSRVEDFILNMFIISVLCAGMGFNTQFYLNNKIIYK